VELKKGYKQTEVGVIPEEWEVASLGTCLTSSPDYGINAPAVRYSDNLPVYIRITDITEDGRFSPDKRVSVNSASSGNYFLKDGDIVFARTGASVGKSYRYNPKDGLLVFAGFLIRVRPDVQKLLPDFAAAYVTTGAYWQWVRLMSMRSGQPGINGNEYTQLPIPRPSLHEQRAIAAALSDVDGLIGGLEQLIAKKRDLKQAAMQQLLTGKKRLAGFRGEWKVKRLGEIGVFSKGRGIKKGEVVADGLPCVRYGEIYTHHNDYLKSFNSFITPATAGQSARIQKGDLLFAGSGETAEEIGKCIAFLGEEEAYAGGDIVVFRPKGQDSKFLGFLMNYPSVVIQKSRMGQGDAVVHISARNLALLELNLPPIAEQTAIAEVLSDMDAELAALAQRRDKTRALKQGMMQALLTGRVRLL
jgi:type I restriction enzyme, S subunit